MHSTRRHPIIKVLLLACGAGIASLALRPPATEIPPPALSDLVAKDIKGLGVFGTDGQRVGRVAKVNATADGVVTDVEVTSGGFLGLFSRTYLLPAQLLHKRGGRLDLVVTSGEARQFRK
jgi:hypothetical protein